MQNNFIPLMLSSLMLFVCDFGKSSHLAASELQEASVTRAKDGDCGTQKSPDGKDGEHGTSGQAGGHGGNGWGGGKGGNGGNGGDAS